MNILQLLLIHASCSHVSYFIKQNEQIYVSNNYCDVSSLGFHISVIIASNKKQIIFLQTSTIVD